MAPDGLRSEDTCCSSMSKNVQIEKRGLTGDIMYTTIVNDDVEALLGYDMIEAYLHNSRKSMWALQRLELFGI